MAYTNRRRRGYSRVVRIRGGSNPVGISKVNTPSYGGFSVPNLIATARILGSAFRFIAPKKYEAFRRFAQTPAGAAISDFAKKTLGAQPGVGVVISTAFKTPLRRVINKGTGVTKTSHVIGTYTVPDRVKANGLKTTYVRSNTGDNFALANTSAVFNGVAELPTLRAGVLQTIITGFPSGQYSTGQTGHFYIGKVHTKMTVTSATNLNCRLRIYECVARQDNSNTSYITPIAAWSNGLDASLGTISATDYQSIGVYPSHSVFFREFFHVEQMYDIELAAGGSHVHESHYNISTVFANCRVQNYSTSHNIAGLTRFRLLVLSSTPIHDAVNEDNVALGVVTVDINNQETYEVYALPSSENQMTLDLLADIVTTAEVVTDSSISETGIVN